MKRTTMGLFDDFFRPAPKSNALGELLKAAHAALKILEPPTQRTDECIEAWNNLHDALMAFEGQPA